MSAWDAGYAAGRKWRTDDSVTELDPVVVREQAVRDVGSCPHLPLTTRQEMVTDWLYGFYKAAFEEADDAP